MSLSSLTSTYSHANSYHIHAIILAKHCVNFDEPISHVTRNPTLSNSIIPPVVQEGLSLYSVHPSPSLKPTFIFK